MARQARKSPRHANQNLERIPGITNCRLIPEKPLAQRAFVYDPPADTGLEICHQDNDLLVLVKPAGLLSVPGRDPAHFDCLEYRVKKRFGEAGIVHRLDMATSGLMVLALNRAAHRHLGLQFERRKVKKQYLAAVAGTIPWQSGAISLPMRCDWPERPRQMVDYQYGRQAETGFEVLARESAASLVRLYPETGRSHQLRLHLAELGHPILGDSFYGDDDSSQRAQRLMLHAERLAFHHPVGGRLMTFQNDPGFSLKYLSTN